MSLCVCPDVPKQRKWRRYCSPRVIAVLVPCRTANRDPRQFPNPDTIDPRRADGKHLSHLAFGGGVHYCLGAALARLEMRIALTTMTQRYPDFRVLDDPVRWRDNIALRGPNALHVRFGREAHA